MPNFVRNLWLTAPMMQGGDVAQAQNQLQGLGVKLSCDGLYGRATRDAVLAFQKSKGTLTQDGILGIQTWSLLFDPNAKVFADRVASDILTHDVLDDLSKDHGYFVGGVKWRLSNTGVIVDGDARAVYGSEDENLVRQVVDGYSSALVTILSKVQVPIELVVACICVESAGRPAAERHEKGCSSIDPALTPSRVSVGLMQTLLSTATNVLERPLQISDLRNPLISIEAGATYMWRQSRETRFDPVLVACAYNAGSLLYNDSSTNRFRLVQYPINTSEYVDKFLRFFNASMNHEPMRKLVSDLNGRVASLFRN